LPNPCHAALSDSTERHKEEVSHAPQSILSALNFLVQHAADREIDVGSFLHADMIPLDRQQFYCFLERFVRSGKMLSFTPIWPDTRVLDFCNLHFRIALVLAAKLFPASLAPIEPRLDFNENQLNFSFHRSRPGWLEEAYQMWTMVMPFTGQYTGATPDGKTVQVVKMGHTLDGCFVVHNFTPESSVIHTNDPWFWDHYESVARLY
jgi:hypothetical protein